MNPTVRMIRSTLLITCVAVVLMVCVAAFLFRQSQARPAGTSALIDTPTRSEVNIAVARLIAAGRAGDVYAFYAMEVGDPLKASFYVLSALASDVPVDLRISQGWWEGGHQVGVLVGPNQNGSYDASPSGLNSITYQAVSLSELTSMEFNIPQGAAHLRDSYRSLGGVVNDDARWETALAVYNKGSPRGLDQNQVRYVAKILRHEWELDRRFAARFPEAF
jgi:hypothetical protein